MIKKYLNCWINTKYCIGNYFEMLFSISITFLLSKKKKLNDQFYNAIGVKNQEFGLDEKLKKADLRKVNNLI